MLTLAISVGGPLVSVHDPSQYSPEQILEAARRAEAEGRVDFANQLYRHLADSYPHLPVATAARDGLARLNGQLTFGSPPAPSLTNQTHAQRRRAVHASQIGRAHV